MKIYLAGSWARRAEIREHARKIEAMGHTVTSSWLSHSQYDSHDDGETVTLERGVLQELADQDLRDVDAAETLVAFTEQPGTTLSRGGRHVEFGYALAKGLRLLVVGPEENIFHTKAAARFDTATDLMDYLQETDAGPQEGNA